MHTPPVRLLELAEHHAVLASGSHWMAADVVLAKFARRAGGGVLDGGAIEEPNGGGIMRDRRILCNWD